MKTILAFIALISFIWQQVTEGGMESPKDINIGLLTSGELDGVYASVVEKLIESINRNRTSMGKSQVALIHRSVSSLDVYILSSEVCTFVTSGVLAIFTKTSSHVNEQIWSMAVVEHIPVIPVNWAECSEWVQGDCSNETVDDAPRLAQVVSSIVLTKKWDEVQLFYDESYGKHVNWLVDHLFAHGLQISLFNIHDRNISAMLEVKATFQNYDYFIVMASMTRTSWLLVQARVTDLDILGPKYKWLIADEDNGNRERLLPLLKEGDNVAFLAEDRGAIESRVSCSLQWLLEELDQVMEEEDGLEMNEIQTCNPDTHKVPDSVGRMQLHINLKNSPRSFPEPEVLIYTLAPHPASQIHWEEIGAWSLSSGLHINGFLFPEIHRGFNDRTFLITTVHYPPFMIRYDNGTYDGICFDLLAELQAAMNFSYKVIPPDSQDFGTKQLDGNFTGMMKLIQRKEVDFAVAIFGVNAERKEVADFTTPFMADPTIILMKRPDLATSQVFICLGPFNYQVWFLIALSVIVVGIFLWVLVWVHPLHSPRYIKEIKNVGIYDPKINIWQIFGALMQQGMVYIPESHSARIMISAWWFYTIVVVGTYNGNLIAFLTAPKVNTPVNTLSELADSGMKFGFARGTMVHGVFKTADDGIFKQLWDSIKDSNNEYIVDDNGDGMELALNNPGYAFILEKSFYDTLPNKDLPFQNESCRFARAKESFLNMYYAFPFQKGSPYVKIFDKVIMRILEAGLLEKWRRKWYSSAHRCTGLERTKEQSNISLAEAQGAFYILAIGLFVATLVLLFEKIWIRSKGRKRNATTSHSESNGIYSNGAANGAIYHVGSLPPIVRVVNSTKTKTSNFELKEKSNKRDMSRTEEIQQHYARMQFSPYPVVRPEKKVKRSRSFPLMFPSCCKGSESSNADGGTWAMSETNIVTANGTAGSRGATRETLPTSNATVSLLFSYSPAIAWYDKNGRTPTGSLRRRWHSDVGSYMDGRYIKDAETGEYLKQKGKRK